GSATVELEITRARSDVGVCLLERLATVARLDHGQLRGSVEDGARERSEQPPLVRGCEPSPRTVERRARGTYRSVDVAAFAACDDGKRPAIRGIDHRQTRARGGGDPAVGYEMCGRGDHRRPCGMRGVHRCGLNLWASVFSSVRGT